MEESVQPFQVLWETPIAHKLRPGTKSDHQSHSAGNARAFSTNRVSKLLTSSSILNHVLLKGCGCMCQKWTGWEILCE